MNKNQEINEEIQLKTEIAETIQNALTGGCKFVSFLYRAKGTGELAKHTVALGVNLERVYRRDRAIVSGKLAHLTGLNEEAGRKILASLNDSLKNGIGNNQNYTQKDTYDNLGKGVKIHRTSGELEIYGFSHRKEIIEPGEHKSVKSAPLTLAKKEIERSLKKSKFRQFCLSKLRAAKIAGDTIILDVEN